MRCSLETIESREQPWVTNRRSDEVAVETENVESEQGEPILDAIHANEPATPWRTAGPAQSQAPQSGQADRIEATHHYMTLRDDDSRGFPKGLMGLELELQNMRQQHHIHAVGLNRECIRPGANARVPRRRRCLIDFYDQAVEYAALGDNISRPEVSDLNKVVAEQIREDTLEMTRFRVRDQSPRPAGKPFVEAIAAVGSVQLNAVSAGADRHLTDCGDP